MPVIAGTSGRLHIDFVCLLFLQSRKVKDERSTRLVYTVLHGLEHLMIETRLIYERLVSVVYCKTIK